MSPCYHSKSAVSILSGLPNTIVNPSLIWVGMMSPSWEYLVTQKKRRNYSSNDFDSAFVWHLFRPPVCLLARDGFSLRWCFFSCCQIGKHPTPTSQGSSVGGFVALNKHESTLHVWSSCNHFMIKGKSSFSSSFFPFEKMKMPFVLF